MYFNSGNYLCAHLAGHAIDYFGELNNDALHYQLHKDLESFVVTYRENTYTSLVQYDELQASVKVKYPE